MYRNGWDIGSIYNSEGKVVERDSISFLFFPAVSSSTSDSTSTSAAAAVAAVAALAATSTFVCVLCVCVCVGEGSKVKESIIIFATTLSACLYTLVFQCNWNNNYNYKKRIKK